MQNQADETLWLPVLGYHRVVEAIPADDYCKLCVTRWRFEQQMCWFARLGYRTLSLDQVAGYIKRGEPLPAKRFVITFDDGYVDNLTVAAPILRAYGFTATVFVVSGLVGECNKWDQGRSMVAPLMTWHQLEQWLEQGQAIGSHTVTHPHLSQLSREAARDELVESRRMLETRLGIPVRTFCYPYGDWSEETCALVAETGYDIACNNTGRWEHGRYTFSRVDPVRWAPPLTPLIRSQRWYFEVNRRGTLDRPRRALAACRRGARKLALALGR